MLSQMHCHIYSSFVVVYVHDIVVQYHSHELRHIVQTRSFFVHIVYISKDHQIAKIKGNTCIVAIMAGIEILGIHIVKWALISHRCFCHPQA